MVMGVGSVFSSREIARKEWDFLWSKVNHTNILQSWEYGDAKSKSEGWKPIRLVFEDENNIPVGLAQVLTKTLPIIGGFARLNRGPLLVVSDEGHEGTHTKLQLISHIQQVAKTKRWWFFYLAPEIGDNETEERVKTKLQKLGLKERSKNLAWGSSRFSLEPDEDILIAGLKGKWRNLLKKAQKSDLMISHGSCKSNGIGRLIEFYKAAKISKSFSGISADLLRCLSEQDSEKWKFNYYFAEQQDTLDLAGVLVCVIHGDTATYLIGNTTDLGRRTNANYSLLWHAIVVSKNFGCRWFDLGGFNANTPSGIRHFKEGLKGQTYNLIGEYKG